MKLKKYGVAGYGAPIAIVGIALVAFYLLQVTAPVANSHAADRQPIAVETTRVSVGAVPLRVRSQGTVRPRTETQLTTQVAGEIIWISHELKSGGRFQVGETLLKIDSSDHEVALQKAEADLKRAQAELSLAQTELDRVSALHRQSLASKAQLQQAQRNVDVAEAMALSASSAIDRARLDLKRTTIAAPYTGRVRATSADLGQFVQRGNLLATLYATDRVEVRLPLPDAQLAYLDPALLGAGVLDETSRPAVTLRGTLAGTTRSWHGAIVRTEGEIDQASRMVHVVAEVEAEGSVAGAAISAGINPSEPDVAQNPPLPVGLFVEADIEGITVDNVAQIPRSAILAGNRVLLVDAANRLVFREVELLRLDEDSALISGGLRDGDTLCLTRLQTPVEGMQVTPVPGNR